MRICFYSPHAYQLFNPSVPSAYGGAEVQLYRLATTLAKRADLTIVFIVGDYGQPLTEVRKGVHLIRTAKIGQPQSTVWGMLRGVWQSLREAKADVYVARAASAEVGMIGLFCWRRQRRFIYMVAHEMDCTGEFVRMRGLAGKSFGYGLRRADLIIAQNTRQQQLLRQNVGVSAPLLPSGIQTRLSQPLHKGDSILWVARCETWKNPQIFLDLVEALPDSQFTMISPRQDHQLELYIEVLERAQHLKNLTFVPKAPYAKVQDYFNRAKLFVNTSSYEGFPNTFLQAAVGATPTISLQVDPDQVIERFGWGACLKGDIRRFPEVVKTFMTDQDVWKNASQAARAWVIAHHDLERSAQRFLTLAQQPAGRSRNAPLDMVKKELM